MVPYNNYDVSQESWLTASTGVTKLAVILITAICLLFFMLMLFLGEMRGTECPENNSIEYEDCILRLIRFSQILLNFAYYPVAHTYFGCASSR